MQRRNLYLFLILSVLLFFIALMLFRYSHSLGSLRIAERDFSVDRSMEVMAIEMENVDRSERVLLEKANNEPWRLNESYYANEAAVRDLLNSMQRLTVRQPISMENRPNVNERMLSEGIQVRVWVKDYRIRLGNIRWIPYTRVYQAFTVGGDTPDGLSTYIKKEGAQQGFKVHIPSLEGGIAHLFSVEKNQWRDPMILDLAPTEVKTVKVIAPDQQSYLLSFDGDEFAFSDITSSQPIAPDNLDTTRVLRFLSSFHNIYYESLLDTVQEQERKKLMLEQPFMEITVESTYGEETFIRAFARKRPGVAEGQESVQDPNRFYVQVNEGEYALAQYYVFSRILRPFSFFEN